MNNATATTLGGRDHNSNDRINKNILAGGTSGKSKTMNKGNPNTRANKKAVALKDLDIQKAFKAATEKEGLGADVEGVTSYFSDTVGRRAQARVVGENLRGNDDFFASSVGLEGGTEYDEGEDEEGEEDMR